MVAVRTFFIIAENINICGTRHKSLTNGAFRFEKQAGYSPEDSLNPKLESVILNLSTGRHPFLMHKMGTSSNAQ